MSPARSNRRLRQTFDSQAADPFLVSLEHFNFESAKGQMFTRPRQASFLCDHQTRNRREVVRFNLHVEQPLDLSISVLPRTSYAPSSAATIS
jgi:hypothetical protein